MDLRINNNYQCRTSFGCKAKQAKDLDYIAKHYLINIKRKDPTTVKEYFTQSLNDASDNVRKFANWFCKKIGFKKS